MTSLLPTIQAKSDQLNAEDLIGGPRQIRVTGVDVRPTDEQPVWVFFEGDNGKPFKPCKTVRRLLVRLWGDDSAAYSGRSMTLFLDPQVKYGGMAVGGIRVSHVSHIDKPQSFFLTETRGKKRQITVAPIKPEIAPDIGPALADLDAAQDLQGLQSAWMANRDFHGLPEFVAMKDAKKAALSNPEQHAAE